MALLPLACGLGLVCGCASGSGLAPNPVAVSGRAAATGRAVFTMTWPARKTSAGKLIPIESNSIQVAIENAGGVVASKLLVRSSSSGGSQVATITFDALNVGAYTVVATAIPNADGTAAPATGAVSVTVLAGTTTSFTLTMLTTVTGISIFMGDPTVALPATLAPGATLQRDALATDASGDSVLTPINWTATDPSTGAVSTIVNVLSNGLVTAPNGSISGTARVSATDPESGVSGSTAITAGTPGSSSSPEYVATPIAAPPNYTQSTLKRSRR